MDFRDVVRKYARKGKVRLDVEGVKVNCSLEESSPYYEKEVFIVFKDGVKKLLDYAFEYRKVLSNITGGLEKLPWEVYRVDHSSIITALSMLPDNIREEAIAIVQQYRQIRYVTKYIDGWGECDYKVYTLSEPTFVITPFERVSSDAIIGNKILLKKVTENLKFPPALPAPAFRRRSRISNIFRNLLQLARV